jgi:hypothetical protein
MDLMSIITIVSLLIAIFSVREECIGVWKYFSKPTKLEGEWTSFHLNTDETGKSLIRKGKWIFHRTFVDVTKVKVTFKEICTEEYDGTVFYSPPINIFNENYSELALIRILQIKLASIMLFGIFKDTVHGIWFGPEDNNALKAYYFILTTRALNDREAEGKIIEGRRRFLGDDFIC